MLDFDDIHVKQYIDSLNSSIPNITFTEEQVMNSSGFVVTNNDEFYDLELSRKINNYIKQNKYYYLRN